MITMRMMQMTIVDIIDVVTVLDSGVPTARTVGVVVIRMLIAAHGTSPCWMINSGWATNAEPDFISSIVKLFI